uniref:Uncharacterized protein n=1 Tax=Davidia involucrata TaxID=16924 RepID=A0A5B6YKH2_DAVIN
MEENTNRAEAIRLLEIAEKLSQGRDLSGSIDFTILAQEIEPLLDGSDQILAITDVLLASEKRINNHHNWYAILQVDRHSDDRNSTGRWRGCWILEMTEDFRFRKRRGREMSS